MARHHDREFSESDHLQAADMGRVPDDGIQDRQPAWAQRMEEARGLSAPDAPQTENREADRAEERPGRSDATDASLGSVPHAPAAVHEEDAAGAADLEDVDIPPAREEEDIPPEREAADGPDQDSGAPDAGGQPAEQVIREQARKEQAQQAWQQEAQRVESTMFARRRLPGDRLDLQEAQNEKSGRGKRAAKQARRKTSKRKKKKGQTDERQGFLRKMAIILVCSGLFLMLALMVVSSFVSHPILSLPRRIVTAVVSPVQSFFSRITDGVVDYLRMLKIRGNIEYEYEQVRIQLDDYATLVAQDEELRHTIEELYDQLDEMERNRSMNPLAAQVIGTDSGTYFSTLTLDVGRNNGVTDNMAVVSQGGLVGVTYNVKETTCQVSCIINSNCTVAGLVQSSRDQGSVKGTLGTNGEPMCRMYYLPDTSLPRPGDVVVTSGVGLEFPKGIPIGYIRESTRGMEDNKSYVVLEPVVDFQHLEYVTVYRYRPSYAEPAQNRTNASSNLRLEPLVTAQPVPTFQVGGVSDFIFSATQAPEEAVTETPAPTATPSPTPSATPAPKGTDVPPNLEYIPADLSGRTPTPSPRPTFTPAPTPAPTPDPGQMMVEDDE